MNTPVYLTPAASLQRAFDQAAPGTVFCLRAGTYREKVIIKTPNLTILGESRDETKIVWDDYALKKDENGVEYNTFRTWTLAVCADHITIKHLSIVNDALEPEKKGQEVALSVLGDDFRMENCRLTSTQDTLFSGPLPPDLIERYQNFHRQELLSPGPSRQVYKNCLIEGSVDFIFGCGDALFENCEIRNVYDVRQVGYAAAPAHPLDQQDGFVFRRCRFTCESTVQTGSIYLARPWRDWGLCRFEHCTYGPHIAAAGFDKWNDTNRDQTARFYEEPPLPGRVPWVNRNSMTGK